jgi:hypothetical protein
VTFLEELAVNFHQLVKLLGGVGHDYSNSKWMVSPYGASISLEMHHTTG